MPNPDPYLVMLREQAESYRHRVWSETNWVRGPALVSRDGTSSTPYRGQHYDNEQFQLIQDGWDHEHCRFCWATISDAPGPNGFSNGFTDYEGNWLCPNCHQRIIVSGADPKFVIDNPADDTNHAGDAG